MTIFYTMEAKEKISSDLGKCHEVYVELEGAVEIDLLKTHSCYVFLVL